MKNLKIAGCFLNQTPLDWAGNETRIRNVLKSARQQAVSILCLPELCITGYGCEDAFFRLHVLDAAWESLERLLPETHGLVATFGLPVLHQGAIFNTVALVADGKIVGLIPKKALPGDGVHYEPRWFKPWEVGLHDEFRKGDHRVPFGDLHFDLSGVRIGLEICEEAWVAHRPGARLSRKNIDFILNPSASHFAFGKIDVRKGFVTEGSRAFGVTYVYSNLVGNEAGRIIYDGGVLIAAGGKLIAQGPRFSFEDGGITSVVVDLDLYRTLRARRSTVRPLIEDEDHSCVFAPMEWTWVDAVQQVEIASLSSSWEGSSYRKEEELARAVSLGLFDFLRKSRQHGFVVSLSGGIDSAVVAWLAALSIRFGIRELGLELVKERLHFIPEIRNAESESEMIQKLLHCAYQSTRNSSTSTFEAARDVAQAIQATFYDWSVDAIVDGYSKLISDATETSLSWENHDLALQNIQARSRGPSIWMLTNLKNAILLATSNRSEVAVGYATMDGDTCGGLSPIAGVDKAFLKHWIRWAQSFGPEGIGGVLAFELITRRPPTAELRPSDQKQTDEADLMPYEILDQIERYAIRDQRSPLEIFDLLSKQNLGYSAEEWVHWIKRFFLLWSRNQWKRERYAPSFHLDDESLDPKTWCRFPILSGGFQQELIELEQKRGRGVRT